MSSRPKRFSSWLLNLWRRPWFWVLALPSAAIVTWLLFFPQVTTWGESFPGQLAGLVAAFAGMLAGSLLPQLVPNHHNRAPHLA